MTKRQQILNNVIANLDRIAESAYLPYNYFGIRFDHRSDLAKGFVFDNSKANPERADEREFPEYGSKEYNNLEDLNGTCAYDLYDGAAEKASYFIKTLLDWFADEDQENKSWYIVGSDFADTESGEDNGEIIMQDCTVIQKLF